MNLVPRFPGDVTLGSHASTCIGERVGLDQITLLLVAGVWHPGQTWWEDEIPT